MSRTQVFFACGILVLGAVAGFWWVRPKAVMPLSEPVRVAVRGSGDVEPAPVDRPILAEAEISPTTGPAPLSPEKLHAMMVTTMERGRWDMSLRMAEHRAGLQLTEQQHARLLDDVIDFAHIRGQFEKALVSVKSFDGKTLTLNIAAYPDQGVALRTAFVKQISGEFPPNLVEVIERALPGPMSEIFGGFGQFSQDSVVTLTDSGDFRIRYTAQVPGDVKTAETATLELALKLSGNGTFSREAFRLFHEAIADVVNAHFPSNESAEGKAAQLRE